MCSRRLHHTLRTSSTLTHAAGAAPRLSHLQQPGAQQPLYSGAGPRQVSTLLLLLAAQRRDQRPRQPAPRQPGVPRRFVLRESPDPGYRTVGSKQPVTSICCTGHVGGSEGRGSSGSEAAVSRARTELSFARRCSADRSPPTPLSLTCCVGGGYLLHPVCFWSSSLASLPAAPTNPDFEAELAASPRPLLPAAAAEWLPAYH